MKADTRTPEQKAQDSIAYIVKNNKVDYPESLNNALKNMPNEFFESKDAKTLLFLLLQVLSPDPKISEAALTCIKNLLDKGATFDLSMKDTSNNNLLHLACLQNNKLAVEKILGQDTAKTLINNENATGRTPLYIAIQQDEHLVTMLIDAGANVNAVNNHKSYDSRQLKKIANKRTPLHTSASNSNNPAIAQLLINAGANVNAQDVYGTTALHLAAWYEHPEMVKTLLENGAQVNAQTNTLGNWDTDGATPLHEAAMRGNIEIIEQLIDDGADLTIKNAKGQTPLVSAISALQFSSAWATTKEAVKSLIQQGAALNLDEIKSLLHYANVKKALLDMGILKITPDPKIYELDLSTKTTKSPFEDKLRACK